MCVSAEELVLLELSKPVQKRHKQHSQTTLEPGLEMKRNCTSVKAFFGLCLNKQTQSIFSSLPNLLLWVLMRLMFVWMVKKLGPSRTGTGLMQYVNQLHSALWWLGYHPILLCCTSYNDTAFFAMENSVEWVVLKCKNWFRVSEIM